MITVQTSVFEKYPIEQMLTVLQKLGVKQVELHSCHLPYRNKINCEFAKEVVSQFGMEIVGYVWEHRGVNPWWDAVGFNPYLKEGVKPSIQCLLDNIEIAKTLGVSFMTIFETHKPDQIEDGVAWQRLLNVFKVGTQAAQDAGLILENEFHPGMFASTMEKAPRLIEEIDSPNFRACVDLCHANIMTGGDPHKLIKILDGYIGHVHLASGNNIPHLHLPVGTGQIDVYSCIDQLKKISYQGLWSLCLFGFPFPEYAVKVSLANLRKNTSLLSR